jgi:hypothetical protein
MNGNWVQDRLVELKQQDVLREAEQAHFLREAGLAGESWLARVARSLRGLLQAPKGSPRHHRRVAHHAHQSHRAA